MNFDNPRTGFSLEKLDDGIFFEKIGFHTEFRETNDAEQFVFGDADADCSYWSYQNHENTSGITCLKYAIEQLTSDRITENELCAYAESSDLEIGISTGDMLEILENYGLTAEYNENTSLRELMEMLEEGKVICTVSSILLEPNGLCPYEGSSADMYVQVIEIDIRDPMHQVVRLNVPFDSDGAGKVYDLPSFSRAWKAGNKSVIYVGRGN